MGYPGLGGEDIGQDQEKEGADHALLTYNSLTRHIARSILVFPLGGFPDGS